MALIVERKGGMREEKPMEFCIVHQQEQTNGYTLNF